MKTLLDERLEFYYSDEYIYGIRYQMQLPKGCNYIDAEMVSVVNAGVHWERQNDEGLIRFAEPMQEPQAG